MRKIFLQAAGSAGQRRGDVVNRRPSVPSFHLVVIALENWPRFLHGLHRQVSRARLPAIGSDIFFFFAAGGIRPSGTCESLGDSSTRSVISLGTCR